MMMPVSKSLSWDDFESAHLLQFLPFEEAQLWDMRKACWSCADRYDLVGPAGGPVREIWSSDWV